MSLLPNTLKQQVKWNKYTCCLETLYTRILLVAHQMKWEKTLLGLYFSSVKWWQGRHILQPFMAHEQEWFMRWQPSCKPVHPRDEVTQQGLQRQHKLMVPYSCFKKGGRHASENKSQRTKMLTYQSEHQWLSICHQGWHAHRYQYHRHYSAGTTSTYQQNSYVKVKVVPVLN
jgi:hypothetical protein